MKQLNQPKEITKPEGPAGILAEVLIKELQKNKSLNLCMIDVQGRSSLTDLLLICEGRSQLHCRGIAEKVVANLKKQNHRPLGIEGEREGNWILVDFGDVILHVFHPEIRKFYDLEGLHASCPVKRWPDPE